MANQALITRRVASSEWAGSLVGFLLGEKDHAAVGQVELISVTRVRMVTEIRGTRFNDGYMSCRTFVSGAFHTYDIIGNREPFPKAQKELLFVLYERIPVLLSPDR